MYIYDIQLITIVISCRQETTSIDKRGQKSANENLRLIN